MCRALLAVPRFLLPSSSSSSSPLPHFCPPSRFLTSSEVSNALRPFYFLVHPDLFGRFPEERAVNERSLKTLRSYVDSMVADRVVPQPARLKFYLRPRGVATGQTGPLCRSGLRSVTIMLDASGARDAVRCVVRVGKRTYK